MVEDWYLVLMPYVPLVREHVLKPDSLGEPAPRDLERSALPRELASNGDRVAHTTAHLMAPSDVVLLVFLKRKHYKKHSLTKKPQPLDLVITHKVIAVTWITVLLFFFSDCRIYFRNT